MKPAVFDQSVQLGSDPEVFLSLGGKTIGSEKVIAENGMQCSAGKFIRDGIQIELNPAPSNCRAYCGNNIAACFRDLRTNLKRTHPDVLIDFSPVVKVTKAEMATLSEKSKVFGCAPSTNVYEGNESKITVDPKKYLKRSGGGHLHFGVYGGTDQQKAMLVNPNKLVPVFDAILGNTCVLIDRDKSNIERRKNYGKCGEFRLKPYGTEYRTLSNFWLKSYPLMSFVYGMGRFAIHLAAQSTEGNDYIKAIESLVPKEKIVEAVNTNNFDLAYENFTKLEPLIIEAAGEYRENRPLTKYTIKEFHHFVSKGLDYWFKEHPLKYWCDTFTEGHGIGWEAFSQNQVRKDMEFPNGQLAPKKVTQIWA